MTTTLEHLGPDANQIDLNAYLLGVAIVRGDNPSESEEWAEEWLWGDYGDWPQRFRSTVGSRYPRLSPIEQETFDLFIEQRFGTPKW